MPTIKRQTRTMRQMFPLCIGFIAQGFISQLALYRANFLEVVPSCGIELKARNIDVWFPRWQRRFYILKRSFVSALCIISSLNL